MSRIERAAKRRAKWQGRVVELGAPKRSIYAQLTVPERLAAYVQLNVHAWRAAGRDTPVSGRRCDWPGEIFTADHSD